MADTPARQAAAGVLDDVVSQEALIAAHQATDAEAFGTPAPVVAEPLFPSYGTTTEATEGVEQPQDELEVPEINWETPEELKDLLEAPDFEDEDDDEPVVAQSYEPEDEYEDPEKAKLQRELAKLQKKLAWEQEQKAKQGRKLWADEARKYFQFSNPDMIEAKSRRAFLKEAQRQHEQVAKVAKPVFDQLAELKAKAKEEALAEARAEAQQRWGAPITGPQANTNLEDTQSNQRQRLQSGQSLANVLKGKLQRGEVNL